MNGSPLHLPAHIADELAEAAGRAAFLQAELETLRAFYAAWEALHGIANDPLHRKQKEEAAQVLVDNATLLRRMYV